jgi:fructose-1,6-bisphosphatase/inositol monophosphatase family enzyme
LSGLPVDSDAVACVLVEAGQREILPRYRNLAATDIATKSGPNDLVTAADLAAEAFLAERLGALLPGAALVGEEAAARDPGLVARLADDSWSWVVDPVDGTYNFAKGRPGFSVIVALVRAGRTAAGWIHDPLGGKSLAAIAGAGTWMGGRRIGLAAPASLAAFRGAFYISASRAPGLRQRVKAAAGRLGPASFVGSAGMEYLALAEGRLHGAVFTNQWPWDHAAGILAVTEAGGHVAYLDGAAFRPGENRQRPLLMAADAATWRGVADLLVAVGSEPA